MRETQQWDEASRALGRYDSSFDTPSLLVMLDYMAQHGMKAMTQNALLLV
jgi:hypothetical protein